MNIYLPTSEASDPCFMLLPCFLPLLRRCGIDRCYSETPICYIFIRPVAVLTLHLIFQPSCSFSLDMICLLLSVFLLQTAFLQWGNWGWWWTGEKVLLIPDGRDHTEACEMCTQRSGKICIVPVSPVAGTCVSVPQELLICHRMSQKMSGSGVSIFGLCRKLFIATAVSGFCCLQVFFFSSSNLLGIFVSLNTRA